MKVVIGYGNELRGDDGVGAAVARAVAAWQLPEVRVIVEQQLLPELAAILADAEFAIFVDAEPPGGVPQVGVQALNPHPQASSLAHTGDAASLLALAEAVFGHAPPAYLITIPTTTFELGEQLSPLTQAGMRVALGWIRPLLERSGMS